MQSEQTVMSRIVAQIGVAVEIWPGERICQMAGFCVITDHTPRSRRKIREKAANDSLPNSPSDSESPEPGQSASIQALRAYFELSADLFQAQGCRKVAGFLCQSDTPNHLLIFFPKAAMLPCTRSQFFTERDFSVPTPCALPDSIVRRHRLAPNAHIGSGAYPLQRVAQGYLMQVKVQRM